MDIETDIDRNDTEKQKEINLYLLKEFDKKEKYYLSEIKLLKQQIKLLQDKLFGRKTEKIYTDESQLSLFDVPEPSTPILDEPEEITIPSHTRKKKGRKPLPEDLPCIDAIHDLSEEEKQCECGCIKSRIGQEVSKQLDYIPAKVRVIRNIRYKYACKNCEGVEDNLPTVSIARMPDQIIPKSMATPGLLAHIMVAKFVDALPFYRQEKQFHRIGIELPRSTMCNWAVKVASACEILMQFMKELILNSPLINIDETTVQVIKEPNRSKSYMWVFKGGTKENPIVLFEYHPTRSGDVASAFLNGYKGIVQTDGYVGYDFLDEKEDIIHIGCLAHVRRKFMDVAKAAGFKKGQLPTGNTGAALKYIRKLYKIEKKGRKKSLSFEEIYHLRQEESVAILDEFKDWLDAIVEKVPPKTLLGKAINHALNQWDRITPYAEHGIVSPDNNAVENAIRPFAVGRKNWLFSFTPDGARASACLYSLLETAKANGLEPYWYLRYLFEKLPGAMTKEDFMALLPPNIDKSLVYPPDT